ncbi:protein kinase domain-containing protein [Pinirhizobacter sp.]|uniref:serine/threonine-protein kinase n=1 Tax=Pinirhizobacter sp. TaxID=2950432 RepID=UPI002F429F04
MDGANDERYRRAKELAHAAAELPPGKRMAFVRERAGDDAALIAEVGWMLDAIEVTAGLPHALENPVDLSGLSAQAAAPRHYQIIRRLGEGGMGVVYLASRNDGGFVQQVALKFLNAAAEDSPALLERFAQERHLLARLEHPGIARLLDGGLLADGRPFLALEFVQGERIDDWCEEKSLTLRQRITLFLKVCAAVEFAHRHLIIHRDIKPANILVTPDGEPKLLDFGIARMLNDAPDTERGDGDALTLAYASPEQVQKRRLTTAADVYSLGVVLYQLVAGRRPFQDLVTPHHLSSAIVSGDFPPPSRSPRGDADSMAARAPVPADVDTIVMKAMRRQARDRYAGVHELAEDLRRFLEHRPVHARKATPTYRASRFVRRNRLGVAAGALLAVSIVTGLGVSLYELAQARTQERLATRRQHELERAVAFEQSMLEGVDIDAMGHGLADGERRQLGDRAAVISGLGFSDLARESLDVHVVSHALDAIDGRFADEPLLGASLRQSLARVLVTIGSYGHAVRELQKVLDVRTRLLPAGDPAVLSARVDLARALDLSGQFGQSRAAFEAALANAQTLGPDDVLRTTAEAGRARAMADGGELIPALAAQEALDGRLSSQLPASDPRLMQLRRERVATLIRLGRRDEATAIIEPLAAVSSQALGPDHPDTLDAEATLASLLNYRNEYERSLALARTVAAAHERRFGFDHPATLRDEDLVAANLVRLEQFDEARPLLEHIIRVRRQAQGEDQPDTLGSMTTMVRLLTRTDDWAGATTLQRSILEARRRVLGPDHPDTLFAQASLAGFLSHEGKYAQALDLATAALAAQRRTLGMDHPVTFGTLDLIARIHTQAGELAAARDVHAQALANRQRVLGTMDAHTLESATRLFEILERLHQTAQAQAIRQRYMDPLVAMDPATLNASMRDMREGTVDLLTQYANAP